jgi:hypothetical protein
VQAESGESFLFRRIRLKDRKDHMNKEWVGTTDSTRQHHVCLTAVQIVARELDGIE